MLDIDVSFDVKQVTRYLNNIEKQQVPFATHQALNDTAFDARKALRAQATKKLDRPTKFTIDGFQVDKSRSKRHLVAVVFIEDKRWKYLQDIIIGTSKTHRRKGFALPVNIKLNKYGNIPGRKLIKKKNQFVGTINGITGLWERAGKTQQLRLLARFEKTVTHRKRIDFAKAVTGIVNNKFKRHFEKRLAHALRTARY